MKKYLLLIAFVTFSFISKSQLTYQWANSVGTSTSSEYGEAIASDPLGNVYVSGYFTGTIDFDPGPGTATLAALGGSQDIFIAKYNSSGTFIWVKHIGGTNTDRPYDIAADATGVYISGNFMGTCNFNIGGIASNLTSLGGGTDGDGFMARYDVNGSLTWVNRLGGAANDRAYAIAVDASQNVYVSGFIGGNTDFDPGPGVFTLSCSLVYNAYFAKYTSAGALTFAKQIVGNTSEAQDIVIDAATNIYLTGSFSQSCDFNPAAVPTNDLTTSGAVQIDIFLAKYDPAGLYIFVKQMGGIGVDIAFQAAVDAAGNNIFLSGVFSATCDFNPLPATNTIVSAGNGDLFVAKYDASGNYLWANGTGGTNQDYAYGLGIDASNNAYITGFSNGANIDFDPSVAVAAITSTSSSFFIASYNSAGAFNFVNSAGNINSEGRGLLVNSSLYVTGMFASTGDFDFGLPLANLISTGGYDVFYGKYNPCVGAPPAQPSAISGTNNLCAGSVQTYSVVNDPMAISYSWSFPAGWVGTSSTNTISATAGTTGIISVIANGSCGSSIAQTLAVTVNPLPVATATSNSPVCLNSTISFTAGGGTSYLWSGPLSFTSAIQNPTIANATIPMSGAYTVTVSSAAGCTATAFTNVSVLTLPSPLIGSNSPVCVGGTLNLAGSGGITYNWFGPNSFTSALQNPSINNVSIAANGVYTLVATTGGCSNSSTANIIINPLPTPTISSNSPVCQGGTLTLFATGGTTYTWSGPNAFTSNNQNPVINNVQPVNSGTYTSVMTNSNGCSATATLNVIINSSPLITVNNPTVCMNQNLVFAATGGTSFLWSGPLGYTSAIQNPTIVNVQFNMAGLYTVVVTGAFGCTNNAVASVTVVALPQPTITNNFPVCLGGALSFTGGGGVTYTWSGPNSFTNAAQNPIINNVTMAASGVYTLIATVNTCTGSTTASVTILNQPTVNVIASNSAVCAGTSLSLTASGANTYSWSQGGTGTIAVVSPTISTNYSVTGTGTNGCTNVAATSISVNPLPIISVNSSTNILCVGQSATLTSGGANTYTWNVGGNNPTVVISPTATTSYTVSGTDANGCTGTSIFSQNVTICMGIAPSLMENEAVLIFPNPFSTEIFVSNVKVNSKLIVTNTLGQIVFTKDISETNSKINLSELSNGIYFVRISSDFNSVKTVKLVKE